MVRPVPRRLAGAPEDRRRAEGELKLVKVNIDENQELAGRYGIMSIPTMILFKDGEPAAPRSARARRATSSGCSGSQRPKPPPRAFRRRGRSSRLLLAGLEEAQDAHAAEQISICATPASPILDPVSQSRPRCMRPRWFTQTMIGQEGTDNGRVLIGALVGLLIVNPHSGRAPSAAELKQSGAQGLDVHSLR
jgi:hypothetical protein